MIRIKKEQKTVEQMAEETVRKGRGLFISKKNRDDVARLLVKRGISIRRSTTGRCNLHPEYITDFIGEYDTGFGNCDYARAWGNLYKIDCGDRRF